MFTPKMLTVALRYQLIAVAVFSLGTLALWPAGALGVFGGGLLAAGNFWFLRHAASKIFGAEKPSVAWAILLGVKFVAVLGLMALMVLVLKLHPIGMALGLFTLFVGIGGATLKAAIAPKQQSPQT